MPHDSERLAALRQGITAANENGFVAIRVADLKWLLDQLEAQPFTPITDDSLTGDHDDRDQE
jgi:hypothetical protein